MAAETQQVTPTSVLTSEEVRILAMLVKHPQIKSLAKEIEEKEAKTD